MEGEKGQRGGEVVVRAKSRRGLPGEEVKRVGNGKSFPQDRLGKGQEQKWEQM